MTLTYDKPGLRLARFMPTEKDNVQALQLDLRRLGYLRAGVDGVFGPETERAVRALQYDLLNNDGSGQDGEAPFPLRGFNRGRVNIVDGIVDDRLAKCVEDLLADARVVTLPRSDDPAADNRRVRDALRVLARPEVPRPFLLAILEQESGLQHFQVPSPGDPDDFIVVGLDRNDARAPDRITSRGYGVGQFTLFHHPPRAEEVTNLMLDPVRNVGRAVREFREKFDHFVIGNTPGTRADDRITEVGVQPLRPCRYDVADPRFQTDCCRCAADAPRRTIKSGTPLFPGSQERFEPTGYHAETGYSGIADWTTFGCDWPYAARRYNGSGVNSYHYQAQVVQRLINDPLLTALLSP